MPSAAMSWLFYELAKRMEVQDRLRGEILQKRQEKNEAGEVEWTWRDFEEMPYLTAVLKVCHGPESMAVQ
jgi:cytochrome P450